MYPKVNDRNKNSKWYLEYLQNFAQNTSIHGFYYVGLSKIHFFERVLWLFVVTIAACWACVLAKSNWERYSANPTVVSIKKDYRNWENPFPAVTGCLVEKNDIEKTTKYIYEKWNVSPSDPKFEYYSNFVADIANLTYKNMDTLDRYQDDESLKGVDFVELVYKVYPSLVGSLVTFQTRTKSDWTLVLTELGMCFSVNSKFARLLTPRVKGINHTYSEENNVLLRCHYLNGLCYARYDSDPNMFIQYYAHSYLEIVHSSSEAPMLVQESEELEINYRIIEVTSSPDIRYLTPRQRKCRFDDEPLTKILPFYSTTLCYIECRYRVALKLCACKPFFYHFLEGNVCDIEGMLCLSDHADIFSESPKKIGCECPQPCELMTYLMEIPKRTKWETGYFDQRLAFRWGLLPPTTKYYRDVIFGEEDLVVSIGGTLALFLGISFMTITELYFLLGEMVINLFQQYWKRYKQKKTQKAITERTTGKKK